MASLNIDQVLSTDGVEDGSDEGLDVDHAQSAVVAAPVHGLSDAGRLQAELVHGGVGQRQLHAVLRREVALPV